MDIINKAINAILVSVSEMIDDKVGKAKFDKTFTGRIIEAQENNTYTILINSVSYKAKCCTSQTFSIGETVLVTAFQSDFNKLYIVGKA